MSYEMINTHEAVKMFQQLLQPNSRFRVLRLLGSAKMGKSHLLTKVFPSLAQEQDTIRYAILDLRNQMHVAPDILDMALSQLGVKGFDNYAAANLAWSNRPKVEASHVGAFLSRLHITAKDSSDDLYNRDRLLTTQFVRDLGQLNDKLTILFFDSVSNATEGMQVWLMDTLLGQVSQLTHVRVVVAGRSLPEAYGSYAARCQSYQLRPVTAVEEYIGYCRRLNTRLLDQSIRDFALATDYTPGFFAELVLPKFVGQGEDDG